MFRFGGTVDMEVTINMNFRRLLLLVAFGRRTLSLFIRRLGHDWNGRFCFLSLDCCLSIVRSGIAIDARVSKVCAERILNFIGVVALNVLPCFARLAKDRVSIIVRIIAYTLDCVGLFLYSILFPYYAISKGGGTEVSGEGLTREHDRRRQRRRLVCHNL